MHHHIIHGLGGPAVVARHLNVTLRRVGNWGKRGVPWEFRYTVSRLAKSKGVPLPKDFLEPPPEKKRA